jgi:hypothetical protein
MAEGDPLSEPDDSPKQTAKPSALLQNLARIATHATGAHRTYQNARYGSSSGAASAGKRLMSWGCACGWSGAAQELRVSAAVLSCPSCLEAGGLRAA